MADEKKVKGNEPVNIVYTGASKYHKEGDKAAVHSVQAEKLIAKGFAVKEGEDPSGKKKGGQK